MTCQNSMKISHIYMYYMHALFVLNFAKREFSESIYRLYYIKVSVPKNCLYIYFVFIFMLALTEVSNFYIKS
jgi:hypothetical protein